VPDKFAEEPPRLQLSRKLTPNANAGWYEFSLSVGQQVRNDLSFKSDLKLACDRASQPIAGHYYLRF